MQAKKYQIVSTLLPFVLVPIFFIGSLFAQLRYDAISLKHFELLAPIHRFVLPAPIVKYFTFGFKNVLADYYWVTAIQDFNKWDKFDFYYPEYFRIINTLDPKFEYPYIFAALTVPTKQNPASLSWLAQIADKGIAKIPSSWEIPYYTGVEFHTVGKSYERAVHYLAIAATVKGSPEVARQAYALFLLHTATDYQKSRELFAAIYQTADNEETKSVAKERILVLDLIEAIDQASIKYKAIHQQFPTSVETLSRAGLVVIPEQISKRYPISIDAGTGKAILQLQRR